MTGVSSTLVTGSRPSRYSCERIRYVVKLCLAPFRAIFTNPGCRPLPSPVDCCDKSCSLACSNSVSLVATRMNGGRSISRTSGRSISPSSTAKVDWPMPAFQCPQTNATYFLETLFLALSLKSSCSCLVESGMIWHPSDRRYSYEHITYLKQASSRASNSTPLVSRSNRWTIILSSSFSSLADSSLQVSQERRVVFVVS